ncbi:MAG: hypothetical protein MPJ50_11095 [Pirellulales bacterium]|nr:hypothetical protein [Pirellulales bacterium]
MPAWCGIFLALLLILLAVGRGSLFRDPGVFWHTAFGQQILRGEGIPRVDAHSITFNGVRWLDLQWLGECAMALAYNCGGWDSVLLLGAAVLAATYAWLGQRLLATGMHVIPCCVLLGLVLTASSHHFHVRPHLVSIWLLGMTVATLVDIERGKRSIWSLAWLTPLFALWSNIHGGVLGGLATAGITVTGWSFLSLLGQESPLKTVRGRVLASALMASAALALLATPHGWGGMHTCLRLMSMPLPEVIQEHRSLSLFRVEGIAVVLLGFAYIATLRTVGTRQWRVTWVLPFVWLALAFLRVRHAPLFAIVWGVVMADAISRSRAKLWLAQHGLWAEESTTLSRTADSKHTKPAHSEPNRIRARYGVLVAFIPVVLALALQIGNMRVPLLGKNWARLSAAGWPMALADDLVMLQTAKGRPLRLLNQLHYGGFVILHSPKTQVFIDDRCELYGFAFLSEYALAEASEPHRIRGWQVRHKFDAALVTSGSAFDVFLSREPGWKRLTADGSAVLYLSEASPTEPAERSSSPQQPSGGFKASERYPIAVPLAQTAP